MLGIAESASDGTKRKPTRQDDRVTVLALKDTAEYRDWVRSFGRDSDTRSHDRPRRTSPLGCRPRPAAAAAWAGSAPPAPPKKGGAK